ncbi:NAC domain containing protein [Trema orientale]|uniref:NAC domain containing protein n=1 Tax=Trema orientale TaxID=63057 RepID=A0A2P5F3J7_TREOI|nr:NAC domain containing protein [Trema orientale]
MEVQITSNLEIHRNVIYPAHHVHVPSPMAENDNYFPFTSSSSSSNVKEESNASYVDKLPKGFRFLPTDAELIFYLLKKVRNDTLPPNRIRDVDLYRFSPWHLEEMHTLHVSDRGARYYFTPRHRRCKKGNRPNRATVDGYYKASGKDVAIFFRGRIIGSKRSLVFHKGKFPKGDKTDWLMQEFMLEDAEQRRKEGKDDDMKLDDWVLCKLYKRGHPETTKGKEMDIEDEEAPVVRPSEEQDSPSPSLNQGHLDNVSLSDIVIDDDLDYIESIFKSELAKKNGD